MGGIYRGVTSVIARQGANSAVRLSAYGMLREYVSNRWYPAVDGTSTSSNMPIWVNFGNGKCKQLIWVSYVYLKTFYLSRCYCWDNHSVLHHAS